jgi:hypothetical protein
MRTASITAILVLLGLPLAVAGEGLAVAAAPEPEWLGKMRTAYTQGVKNPKDTPAQPPVKVRLPGAEYGYGEFKFVLQGAAIVWDPVNREALFLGGHNGGAPFGTVGSWALAEDGKTWREMKFSSAVLDPLREKAVAARRPAKDGEAAARNVFYGGWDAAKEAEAAKAEPAKLLGEAVKLAEGLLAGVNAATAEGWEKDALAHARPLIEKALAGLKAAQAGFAAGKLDAALLKSCFDAQWVLDEAAGCLASSPAPRDTPSAAYDPGNRCVVLFGGSHHDYMTSDTWTYDCAKKSWRQVWPKTAPSPRMGASLRWLDDKRVLSLSGGQAVLNKMVYQQGSMPAPAGEWAFDAKTGEWAGEGGVAAGTRAYRTVVPGYNPCWYDAAPRGDPKPTADWIAKLQPNTWTAVPVQPAPAPERDWGTAVLDPDRDQVYRWTGGHCADPATIVSTYHPAINRWSIPYVAEIGRKGISFNGRPDCMNHTYLHYAYDPVSKRLICLSMGGTGVYNPDIRDFDCSVDQPFNRHVYETCTVGTARGVVVWTPGFFGILDVTAREWKKLPVTGKLPRSCTDGSAICYDSQRDALWMATFSGYQKASGDIWRYDLKSGQVQAMSPANAETIGKAKGFNSEIRESVYVPAADIVLFNNFVNGKEVAYDPAKNRWVVLNIERKLERQGSVSDTLVWDSKRGLVWNLNSYKAVYVLKVDPKTLVLSDDPAK